MSVNIFPERFSGGEKAFSECGQHHPMGWGPELKKIKGGSNGESQLSTGILFCVLVSMKD